MSKNEIKALQIYKKYSFVRKIYKRAKYNNQRNGK